ncbi:MAG: CHRD domain-containing protein [Pseudomonadales bacterium]
MLKKLLTLCVCLLAPALSQAVIITGTATLNYDQEVEPSNTTPSDATGSATIVFDTEGGEPGFGLLSLSATIEGISLADITFEDGGLVFGGAGPFHIHTGAAGSNGGVVVPFPDAAFFTETATGITIAASNIPWDLTLQDALENDGLYLNLHSLAYGSGEIRGQIEVDEAGTMALLLIGMLGLVATRRRSTA